LSVGEWIALGSAIVGMVFAAGAALAQLATLRERVTLLELSRDKLGERIGGLEKDAYATKTIVEHEISRPYRARGRGGDDE
jgi:hypothetical protein